MGNQFFGINKFPKDWGILVFPISMSRVSHGQSPKDCIDSLLGFLEKISENKIGCNFIYTEGLYMNFEKDAYKTKNNFAISSVGHMYGIKKLVKKNYKKIQIDSAFSFSSWFQMYLSHPDFFDVLRKIKILYNQDEKFQELIRSDTKSQGRRLSEKQINFFLEEHAFVYLLLNMKIELKNNFVNERERWILLSYPGMPPLAQIYLYQKDILNINSSNHNPYRGQYDLSQNKFIDYTKYQF